MPLPDNSRVICLMGPTASGKTEIALQLAETANCEIISVDSAQVYRDMNIGTAKPCKDELLRAPHHLVDIVNPDETYSAARFRHDALEAIQSIQESNKIPLLVGGTFLYFRSLLCGLAELPVADAAIRDKLNAECIQLGLPAMYRKLQQVDAESARKIHPNDSQRIQRALEVFMITEQPMSLLIRQQKKSQLAFSPVKFALAPTDRGVLHSKIEKRFQKMLKMGLIDEVRQLMADWQLDLSMPSMRSVGYRQVMMYLQGSYSRQEMTERAVIATRQLAKRQFTWLRSETDIIRFDSQTGDRARFIELILDSIPVSTRNG